MFNAPFQPTSNGEISGKGKYWDTGVPSGVIRKNLEQEVTQQERKKTMVANRQ